MSNKEDSIGKVKLDYTFYSEQDDHSDDSLLDEILDIVKTQDKKSYGKAILEHKKWQVLYHLSPFRENIISWYPIDNTAKVLEIGSECGAHTGVLCDKAQLVHSIDSSYKACLVNAYRNKDRDNLLINVGDYKNYLMNTQDKYDIITIIGGIPFTSNVLSILKDHLTPNGKILITVNNKIGLRYLAGYQDDVATRLTKNSLEKIIRDEGFTDYRFFYPYPDACLTDVIYSDERLPHEGELNENIRNFDKKRFVFFDEAKTYDDLIENNDFVSFSNSFLVSIGKDSDEQIIYSKISDSRDCRFQIITELVKTKNGISVRKSNKLPEGREWLKRIKGNEDNLNKAFKGNVKICPSTLNDIYLEFDYIEGEGMDKELKKACTTDKIEEIISVLDKYYTIIRYMKTSDSFESTEKFRLVFGERSIPDDSESGNIVNIDMVFPNIITSNGVNTIIDYEWVFDFPIPLEFVFWRGLNYSSDFSSLDKSTKEKIYTHYTLTEEKSTLYRAMEESFQRYVYGDMIRLYDYSRVIPIQTRNLWDIETEVHNLEQHINNLTNELNNIQNSKSWKFLKFFRIVE